MSELKIGEHIILPGQTKKIDLPVAKLYTDADVHLPVYIIRGKKSGPTIFVSAAVHGDELNGIEIIRRLINLKGFNFCRYINCGAHGQCLWRSESKPLYA